MSYKNFKASIDYSTRYDAHCEYAHKLTSCYPVEFTFELGKELHSSEHLINLFDCKRIESGEADPQEILESIKEYETLC